MSQGKKDDGVPNNKLAGATGYALVAAVIAALFGDDLVGVVVTLSYPDDVVAHNKRIDELEKTVNSLKNQALMCSPRYAINDEDPDEDPFEDIWP